MSQPLLVRVQRRVPCSVASGRTRRARRGGLRCAMEETEAERVADGGGNLLAGPTGCPVGVHQQGADRIEIGPRPVIGQAVFAALPFHLGIFPSPHTGSNPALAR